MFIRWQQCPDQLDKGCPTSCSFLGFDSPNRQSYIAQRFG
jgi:hypothetical protein